jgi:hypothetical protein
METKNQFDSPSAHAHYFKKAHLKKLKNYKFLRSDNYRYDLALLYQTLL